MSANIFPQKIIITSQIQNILDAVASGVSIIKIAAFAGTGKTTTLLEIAQRNIRLKLYLVFNESVKKEAEIKFKNTGTVVMTTHSLGYKYIVKAFGYSVKEIKAREIATRYNVSYEAGRYALKVFNNFCNGASLEWSFEKETEEAIFLAQKIFDDMLTKVIPVSHSFYLKAFQMLLVGGKVKMPYYDIVLLDEAQDTNDVTLSIFYYLNSKQKILVGDRHQQIYSFRGSVNAMNKVKSVVLPLTQSFRFGDNIAHKASRFLQLFKGEKLSLVGTESAYTNCLMYATVTRTNGELIKYIKSFIDDNKYFKTIRDPKNIFSLPINLLKMAQGKELDYEYSYLYGFLKDYKRDKKTTLISSVEDFFDYLENACKEDIEMSSAIKAAKISGINELYKKAHENYLSSEVCYNFLTTAHTAKGLEWDSVTITQDFNIPKVIAQYFKDKNIKNDTVLSGGGGYLSFFVKNCKEQRYIDELNLYYVALTRARKYVQDQTFFKSDSITEKDIDKIILKNMA